ncbi:GNAT family N-acetyltransferase [Curtobacterium sp. Leaf261]|uniref:GNAT family N-acetyltransferase n=1 Tax=Curtobacterium sp. Leaf261 TaxID=1736311 RepID=UPI0006FA4540|nr:GNAT family N-acetyltransferase [Curtobacterium sp. Leaf261]KQO62668.1 GNAT family acetyltransferase [Curtobacterium sp. Leaf261]
MPWDVLHDGPLERAELLDLYASVGWSAYTRDPELLVRALDGSSAVFTVRDGDVLVGLARVLTDGATIVYLQDVLVRPSHHRRGVGARLVDAVLAEYSHVRQLVLITDAEPGQRSFYESRGLVEVHDADPALRAFVRLG